jgi:serine/threonine-protein kinase
VAVLAFENLSPDPANAFLAGGVQDEIITQLSKIADLKVISRTSTMQYGSKPANLKQIAKELGVAAILEGSVQKIANQIHVNVQLIKATTDTHLWAETYDRELIDLLKAQSEIALRVASELNSTLTADEKARIAENITNNPEAYALYLKGTEVLRRPAVNAARMEEGQPYFAQAIAHDPDFALAHARLGLLHSRIAVFFDPSPLHKQKGRSEAEEALRLQPRLGEGHVALGFFFGRVVRDYDAALKEYGIAERTAPNDAYIIYGIAHVQMRRGQFRAAIATWERATSLDPMNWIMFSNLGEAYSAIGQWSAAERAKRRCFDLTPGNGIEKVNNEADWSWSYYSLTGSTEKLNEMVARNKGIDDSTGFLTLNDYLVGMVERDFDRAERAIERSPATIFETFTGPRSTKKFLLGKVALARGDTDKARPLFEAELPFARSELAEATDSAPRHAQFGLICAYLGQKEEAIAEGQRAVELLPVSKDAFEGPSMELVLAEIYSRVGEPDKGISLLEHLLTTPSGTNQLFLKDWNWDPLRSSPRFQKLLASAPPKIEYQ